MTDEGSIAAAKWNASHKVPNYRRRFLANIPWAQSFIRQIYLNGSNPFAMLRERLGAVPVDDAGAGRRARDFAISLLTGGLVRRITMLDISRVAVDIAREKAARQGLATLAIGVAEVNAIRINGKYDLIAFSQSLHHIEALEHVIDQVRGALRPGGMLFVSDYIGPTRMQWTDEQLRLMNGVLATLPPDLRHMLNLDGTESSRVKQVVKRLDPATFATVDPSEAVRSGEIESVLRARFPNLEFFPLGGALYYETFRMIAHNFDVEDPAVQALVRSVIFFERELGSAGLLPQCFGVFFCRV